MDVIKIIIQLLKDFQLDSGFVILGFLLLLGATTANMLIPERLKRRVLIAILLFSTTTFFFASLFLYFDYKNEIKIEKILITNINGSTKPTTETDISNEFECNKTIVFTLTIDNPRFISKKIKIKSSDNTNIALSPLKQDSKIIHFDGIEYTIELKPNLTSYQFSMTFPESCNERGNDNHNIIIYDPEDNQKIYGKFIVFLYYLKIKNIGFFTERMKKIDNIESHVLTANSKYIIRITLNEEYSSEKTINISSNNNLLNIANQNQDIENNSWSIKIPPHTNYIDATLIPYCSKETDTTILTIASNNFKYKTILIKSLSPYAELSLLQDKDTYTYENNIKNYTINKNPRLKIDFLKQATSNFCFNVTIEPYATVEYGTEGFDLNMKGIENSSFISNSGYEESETTTLSKHFNICTKEGFKDIIIPFSTSNTQKGIYAGTSLEATTLCGTSKFSIKKRNF